MSKATVKVVNPKRPQFFMILAKSDFEANPDKYKLWPDQEIAQAEVESDALAEAKGILMGLASALEVPVKKQMKLSTMAGAIKEAIIDLQVALDEAKDAAPGESDADPK
ncbi:MAG: hypothetical protein ABIL58_04290 [Pseudomonadota bacterium]